MSNTNTNGNGSAESLDTVIVGAGFAGMYMLYRMRELGFSARVFEAGTGVGGTWYWNRYPGARCDVESLDYQYSFSNKLQKEWNWTERYATQPEILKYANHVASDFDLLRDMQFETRVTSATFDEATNRWAIETDRGGRLSARHFVMATGCLSTARTPDFKGLGSFKGKTYHTGRWPHKGVDFTGQRVGIIGTGSSAIQSIPVIAKHAKHLTVFQRTPNFSLPANNESLTPEKIKNSKENFEEIKRLARLSAGGVAVEVNEKSALEVSAEERDQVFERAWIQGGFQLLQAYIDLLATNQANETVAEFVRAKIRKVVKDPATAELLAPKDHPLGTKRICIDSNYFETYNRDNVTLVSIKNAPIEEITPKGLKTGGKEYEFDAIIFATGFDAMTGALLGVDIKGRSGKTLKDKWAAGPRTYLGLQSEGFPNLFMITGPGSPSVLSNMLISIEQHVDWVADCMVDLRERHLATIEANRDSEDAWVEHVNELANQTLYPQANSWYLGANVPGKPRVFMPYVGGVGAYREKCDEVRAKGYEGFTLRADEKVPARA
jgi:cyclohexanone monooxygenase